MGLDALVDFIAGMTLRDVLYYFWPFFIVDFLRYTLFDLTLLLHYLPKRRRERGLRAQARRRLFRERPLVSVLVPGKNEGRHLAALVDSLRRQTYQHFELIIVDDGSDDDTPRIGRRLAVEHPQVRFIRNHTRGGKASAANTALHFSRGRYVVHLDADSNLRHDSLEHILLPLVMDPQVGAVGGDIRVTNVATSIATRLQGIEYLKTMTAGRTVLGSLGILRIVAGAYGAFRRDVLDRLGGWDVGPGLDGDITLKIRKLGYRIVHAPDAVCYTHVPERFRQLARQRYRWDRSLVRFRLRKHRDLLLPHANFSWPNFFSVAENLFTTLFLNIKWWLYTAQMLLFHPTLVPFIFAINYLLYFGTNLVQFSLIVTVFRRTLRWQDVGLVVFVPLMPFYTGLYLRIVRSFSQLMEFFHRASYLDRWNPWKVSRVARGQQL